MSTFFGVLTLYPWVLGAGLILFLLCIARFYEIKYAELYRNASRRRTHYPFFWVPLILFLAAAASDAFLAHDLVGSVSVETVPGDLAFFIGGLTLAGLGYHMYCMMTRGR
jgi:hypothetical protein